MVVHPHPVTGVIIIVVPAAAEADADEAAAIIARILAVIAITVVIGIGVVIIIIGGEGVIAAIARTGHVPIIAASEPRRRERAERVGEGAAKPSCHDLDLSRLPNRQSRKP